MRRLIGCGAALAVVALIAATQFARLRAEAGDYLALSFSSYWASPVVLVQFAIEQGLAPTEPLLVAGQDDVSVPRMQGGILLSVPQDRGNDGVWQVSAQWNELLTGKAWTAQVDVPMDSVTVENGGHTLQIIFGPNGEMLIGSDTVGTERSNQIDLAQVCGTRTPAADRDWRNETGYFPEIPDVLAFVAPAPETTPHCPAGGD